VARFLARQRALGKSDLILPLYYITAREIEDPVARESDEMASVLASRQFADWRELRFEPFTSPTARRAMGQLASRMRDSFWQPGSGAARPVEQPR
jgi:F-box protein 11